MTRRSRRNKSLISSLDPNRINRHLDLDYISDDPRENADNFDPKWSQLRQMTTDEERYQAIRKRWGNSNIPDPRIDLTFRQVQNNSARVNEIEKTKENIRSTARNKGRIGPRPRRSLSCTRRYENLILDIQQDALYEYCQLKNRQDFELQEMLQIQVREFYSSMYNGNWVMGQNLEQQQLYNVVHLLSNHYQQLQNFIGKKAETIDTCKQYMEEVRAFFTFYQKINDDEVTLQMTDEQYEHTVETERMYSMYSQFYS